MSSPSPETGSNFGDFVPSGQLEYIAVALFADTVRPVPSGRVMIHTPVSDESGIGAETYQRSLMSDFTIHPSLSTRPS